MPRRNVSDRTMIDYLRNQALKSYLLHGLRELLYITGSSLVGHYPFVYSMTHLGIHQLSFVSNPCKQ